MFDDCHTHTSGHFEIMQITLIQIKTGNKVCLLNSLASKTYA